MLPGPLPTSRAYRASRWLHIRPRGPQDQHYSSRKLAQVDRANGRHLTIFQPILQDIPTVMLQRNRLKDWLIKATIVIYAIVFLVALAKADHIASGSSGEVVFEEVSAGRDQSRVLYTALTTIQSAVKPLSFQPSSQVQDAPGKPFQWGRGSTSLVSPKKDSCRENCQTNTTRRRNRT
jgi:hypothetical protein